MAFTKDQRKAFRFAFDSLTEAAESRRHYVAQGIALTIISLGHHQQGVRSEVIKQTCLDLGLTEQIYENALALYRVTLASH